MTLLKNVITPLILVGALVLSPSCKKKEEGGESTDTAETETPPAETETAEVAPEISDDEIPVPEDFEEESETEITEENYEAELDKLATEIEG